MADLRYPCLILSCLYVMTMATLSVTRDCLDTGRDCSLVSSLCYKVNDFLKNGCIKSCGLCSNYSHGTGEINTCLDTRGDCQMISTPCYMAEHREQDACMKTCGKCTNSVTTASTLTFCKDNEECKRKRESFPEICSSGNSWYNVNCPVSCSQCGEDSHLTTEYASISSENAAPVDKAIDKSLPWILPLLLLLTIAIIAIIAIIVIFVKRKREKEIIQVTNQMKRNTLYQHVQLRIEKETDHSLLFDDESHVRSNIPNNDGNGEIFEIPID